MPTTVLVASSEHLSALQQGDLREALAFSGNDTLAALEVIKSQRPHLIALEDTFAATARGRALIGRIEADPSLGGCRVRIVAWRLDTETVAGATDRRREPRFKVIDGISVQIDGRRATLVDVSRVGAQVISLDALRPNQRGRFSFKDSSENTLRVLCGVAWASLEIVGGISRYRAGIEFRDPDATAVEQFVNATKLVTNIPTDSAGDSA